MQEVVRAKPIPRDGRSVLAALRDTYGGAPGSPGQRLRIMYGAQLLRYAVAQMGAPARWAPPDDLVPLIGRRDAAQKNPATPLKDDQLARLLAGIPDPRWRFAVQLMAAFGLRPVELRFLRVSGQKLLVYPISRGRHWQYEYPRSIPSIVSPRLETQSLLHGVD